MLIYYNEKTANEEGTHGCNFLGDLIQGIIIIHSTNVLEDLLCARQYSGSKNNLLVG